MRKRLGVAVAIVLVLGTVGALAAQRGQDTVQGHVAAAKAAAGKDYPNLFARLCAPPEPPAPAGGAARQAPAVPDRSTWHVEPAKVFDNLYFVGQSEYSAWAVTTSAGIIVIDSIFGYSVEDQVVGGLRKLGLDPTQIKYVIVSHGHSDHSGGAKFLQETFGARVILSAADWDLLDRAAEPRPKRDMVATDGLKLTLGDTTLTLHITPGHTLGTISTLVPVRDNGQPHVAAAWGGTLYNWVRNRAAYITPDRPDRFWFDTYIASARRFRDLAASAGADVVISNHTVYDESKTKIPALAKRKPGDPHPYVVGSDAVGRYLTVAEECARAGALRASGN
ncbi:MAG: MBL fold metallo-hydrolase [Luteitalea sp.]|nr:MBL fold metallo-hydrolase [Luteitalea sp.]